MSHDETTTNTTVENASMASLAQFESVSGPPKQFHENYTVTEPREDIFPYTTVYFMGNGEVINRREMTAGPIAGNTFLHASAFMVIRVKHNTETLDAEMEVLKFRGDPKEVLVKFIEAYLKSTGGKDDPESFMKALGGGE